MGNNNDYLIVGEIRGEDAYNIITCVKPKSIKSKITRMYDNRLPKVSKKISR